MDALNSSMAGLSGATTGRDLGGQFSRGNRIGEGNEGNKRMAELRRSIFKAVTEDDVKAVIRSLGESAKGGDVQAAKVFLEFVCGKPVTPIEVSGPEQGPVNVTGLMAKIMLCLAEYPEARFKVAAALHQAANGGVEAGEVIDVSVEQAATEQQE